MTTFLNHYLLNALKRNKLFPLNSIQHKSYQAIANNRHVFLNSPTGSGKTLAYLVPIMNKLLSQPRTLSNPKEPYGALIMTLTKELCIQVYRQIRLLDNENKLKVSRTGSISYFSGIVQMINKGPKTRKQQITLSNLAQNNVINSVNWDKIDILISTPATLSNLIVSRQLNPKFVVIDEADVLLELDKNVAQDTKALLKDLAGTASSRREFNLQRQFFLSCSSFPAKIDRQDSQQGMKTIIRNIEVINGEMKHTLPKELEVKFVRVSELKDCTKIDILISILREQMQRGRTIIFTNSTTQAKKLSKELQNFNIQPYVFSANLDTQSRIKVLTKFQENPKGLLITTDLGARGLDFDVPLVIEFNMAKNVVDYINRAGRTARFGKSGVVISFVEEADQLLHSMIQQSLSKGLQFDEVFSRNRSLSKKQKKVDNIENVV